jgi:signal transduction histidine kinase
MNLMIQLLRWFSGGENQYMRLYGCMKHDNFWVGLTVALDLSIAIGYAIIALHWWRNQRNLPDVPAKRVLATIRNIFIFCGLCGYLFIPIKMFWPAWRLYDIFLMFLTYSTWRYVLSATNLKVVYSELGRSTALAAELERSQEESLRKSQFLNSLSHDLRTPLNGLSLQASVAEIAAQQGDSEALRQALMEIRASTRATATLLDCLLESARTEWSDQQNTPAHFVLADLLDELVNRFGGPAKRKGLRLEMGSASGVTLCMDRVALERILTNLLSNAIKFTEAGSVRVEVDQAKGGVEIHVIDTGLGVASEMHEQLFDEFFQIQNHERDPAKGFGLGLSIARRLARQAGGDITVDSSPGGGSRFSVLLPGGVVSEQVGAHDLDHHPAIHASNPASSTASSPIASV